MSDEGLKLNEYFILIDDDPVYRTIMSRVADMELIKLDVFSSIDEVGVTSKQLKYTAALIDFDLGEADGLETIKQIQTYFGNIPMLLISSIERHPTENGWPASIKRFLTKSKGYAYALEEARKFSELEHRNLKRERKYERQ